VGKAEAGGAAPLLVHVCAERAFGGRPVGEGGVGGWLVAGVGAWGYVGGGWGGRVESGWGGGVPGRVVRGGGGGWGWE